jgi:isoamylase
VIHRRSEEANNPPNAERRTLMKTPERPLHDYLAEVCECIEVRAGVPVPIGTHEYGRGVNFAFFSRHASRVRLELFDLQEATPARVIDLDPACNRTGDVWHVWVEGIYPGQLYAYQVDSAFQSGEGISNCASFSWTPLRR